jgi:hypothetical protein
MLTMAKENNQSKNELPHDKVQQWIIVMNAIKERASEQLGMDQSEL